MLNLIKNTWVVDSIGNIFGSARLGLKSSRGFSLLEVMIVVGVMSVMALGTITLINNGVLGQNGVAFSVELTTFMQDARVVLSKAGACEQNFLGVSLSGTTNISRSTLKDSGGVDRYDLVNTYNDRSIRILAMNLTNYADTGGVSGTAVLVMSLEAAKPITGPTQRIRTFTVTTTKDAGNLLLTCSITGLGGGGGGGGAGTGTGTLNMLSKWSATAGQLQNSGVFESATGQVGIGTVMPASKLDVNGEIKAGIRSSGCTSAADLGKMGYNPATHQMEYCGEYATNGFGTTFAFGWRAMGGPRVSALSARTVTLTVSPAPVITNPVTVLTFTPLMSWAGGIGPQYRYTTQMPTPNDFEYCFVSNQSLFLKLNDPSNLVEHSCKVFNNGMKGFIFGWAGLVLNRPLTFWVLSGNGYESLTCEFTCLNF